MMRTTGVEVAEEVFLAGALDIRVLIAPGAQDLSLAAVVADHLSSIPALGQYWWG